MENSKEKWFTLKTREGCKKILALLIVIMMASSFCAAWISSDGGKIKIEKTAIDVRGASLNGELYYPAGTTDEDSYPAVVVVEGAGVTNYGVRSFAEELAKRGYVVFNLNAYGSGDSETPVYNENDQGPDSYNIFATPMGTLDAVHYLRTMEFVDETRIGVVGHSQGSRRAGYAAIMDCGYLSFNDILITALYEKFDVSISESDLSVDADLIAQGNLNEDQMAHYNTLKAEYAEDYNAMLRSICLVGSTAEFVNPTQMVKVAGIEVERTCKVNMAVVNGSFDFGYTSFNNGDTTKEAWYMEPSEDIVPNALYSVDDVTGTSEIVATFREDTIQTNKVFKQAVEDRSLRAFIPTHETHTKNMISKRTTAIAIDYFNQTLDHNSDVLCTDMSEMMFIKREAFNYVGLIAMLFMLFPIIRLMTLNKKYENCVVSAETIVPEHNKKMGILLVAIGTLIFNYLAIYLTNAGKNISFKSNSLYNLMITAWTPYQLSVWLVVAGVSLTVLYLICTKGFGSFKRYLCTNFKIGVKNILKCLLIALVFIFCGYLMVAMVQYWFLQDFRMWMVAFSPMRTEHWFIAFWYFLLALPFYLVLALTTNYLSDVTMGKKTALKDVTLTVLMNSISIWFLCALTNGLAYGGIITDRAFSSFQLTYGIIVFLPLTTLITRKAYLMTKNVWTGAFTNSLLLAWMLVSMSGTNASYVPQTFLSNFLGM